MRVRISIDMRKDLELLEQITDAEIIIEGRMANSSNLTFRVWIGDENSDVKGIYKPLSGERPLWDFPPGLYKREIAAYQLSEALGYHIVPPTVEKDGPLGEGSLQLFIAHDPNQHYFTLLDSRPDLYDQLRAMAVFDVIANNTDRKGGHVLLDNQDNIWGIDHGVCFSDEFKLRTVIWDFGGEEISAELLSPVASLLQTIPSGLSGLLDDDEITAMQQRCQWLVDNAVFPVPESRYQYPWPML